MKLEESDENLRTNFTFNDEKHRVHCCPCSVAFDFRPLKIHVYRNGDELDPGKTVNVTRREFKHWIVFLDGLTRQLKFEDLEPSGEYVAVEKGPFIPADYGAKAEKLRNKETMFAVRAPKEENPNFLYGPDSIDIYLKQQGFGSCTGLPFPADGLQRSPSCSYLHSFARDLSDSHEKLNSLGREHSWTVEENRERSHTKLKITPWRDSDGTKWKDEKSSSDFHLGDTSVESDPDAGAAIRGSNRDGDKDGTHRKHGGDPDGAVVQGSPEEASPLPSVELSNKYTNKDFSLDRNTINRNNQSISDSRQKTDDMNLNLRREGSMHKEEFNGELDGHTVDEEKLGNEPRIEIRIQEASPAGGASPEDQNSERPTTVTRERITHVERVITTNGERRDVQRIEAGHQRSQSNEKSQNRPVSERGVQTEKVQRDSENGTSEAQRDKERPMVPQLKNNVNSRIPQSTRSTGRSEAKDAGKKPKTLILTDETTYSKSAETPTDVQPKSKRDTSRRRTDIVGSKNDQLPNGSKRLEKRAEIARTRNAEAEIDKKAVDIDQPISDNQSIARGNSDLNKQRSSSIPRKKRSTWFLDELDDSDVDVLVLPPIDGVPWGRSDPSLFKRGPDQSELRKGMSWVPRTSTIPPKINEKRRTLYEERKTIVRTLRPIRYGSSQDLVAYDPDIDL